ncbi:bifunctional 4-hydroxy-2-oxoglutarate aldolase/2-dehydro-3-deoxy-phosphogluconate aldolase [Proteiniclasticum sp. BAD-10]|jgi:2-dehydro-3-deoxyphosphogluconate aldolase/(4S)-4-hydroxy-2-oxoglutarate aldolase|uniref:2-dehydro-3-deoxy-phosphogluconate aldolase n=1 Tax=Proteiniclasticum sediminis TaxID=2804028 RepID=A0A941HQ88_9CLOT|nr:bifunctional 4-hydroxy-2-oxoglutarate aldolase/2-dehydro-3-deoxy-phosphogluconate aldolase [Proteiniclasticum sediminis]MBR0574902.1 bifunctional 4-hydroxy-2-oxoglutarate aldolase/2-dehydro-3-deoxy-phosphogluconate aldolase [Proteiniclasticum sediminis]
MMTTIEKIRKCGIVPVIALDKAEDAVPLAKALVAGGITVAEVTFRTSAAEESIARIAKEVPEMLVGAGTVLTIEQAEKAVAAGAQFIVSPGSDVDVIRKAKELGVVMLPGVVTPTEIIIGLKEGLEIFKFFPAGNYGGLKTIKALAGPFGQITFIPTGGIGTANMTEYLEFNKIEAVGGSWMCPKELVNAGAWEEITRLSKEATDIFKKVRPNA